MPAIGRGLDPREDGWFAQVLAAQLDARTNRAEVAGVRMNELEFRGRVIIKQILIMPVLQQIFIGANGSFLAVALLDDWTFWDLGSGRGISATARHCLDQKRATVGHPLHRFAQHGINSDSDNAAGRGSCNMAEPKLYSVRGRVSEGELGSVQRPLGLAQISVRVNAR